MTAEVKDRVFCPLCEQTQVCIQNTYDVTPGEKADKRSRVRIICGLFNADAGKCSLLLLADGLRHINEKADRLASAAEAIYAVLDPEDSNDEDVVARVLEKRRKTAGS